MYYDYEYRKFEYTAINILKLIICKISYLETIHQKTKKKKEELILIFFMTFVMSTRKQTPSYVKL